MKVLGSSKQLYIFLKLGKIWQNFKEYALKLSLIFIYCMTCQP